jgi:type II secretory ATPase GspE/PulE/Tfp pilus assembly ATPase PilB-like protein
MRSRAGGIPDARSPASRWACAEARSDVALPEWSVGFYLGLVDFFHPLMRIDTDPAPLSESPPAGTAAAPAPGASAFPVARTLGELVALQDALRRRPVLRLRDALLELRLLTRAQLDAIEREDPLLLRGRARELVQRMLLTSEELEHAFARMAAVPEVDVVRFEVPPEAWQILPLREALRRSVVPLGEADGQFFVASARPTDEDLRHELSVLTERRVVLVWAAADAIAVRLELQSGVRVALASTPAPAEAAASHGPSGGAGPAAADLNQLSELEWLVSKALVEVSSGQEQTELEAADTNSGVVQLVKKMIDDALRQGASDIHIETNPGEQTTLVRFRRDGDLEPYLQLPARLRGPLVSRIKIMAKLDIAEHRRPQDGKIDFAEFGGPKLELRVAVLPTHDGLEDVVLRLLATSKPLPLSRLGLQPRDEATFHRMISRTFGLILAAGPTGSGKTTTLHSMLAELNTGERKIWTAEDPIEITQPGLRQVQVNPKIGLTFAAAMRSFLRADPDVIMIGEIRDAETAKIAIEASLTGHLVLSTLHTNSASESVVRLLDLGMDAMNFADSLIGIVAQRLVRLLCPHCAVPVPMTAEAFTPLVLEYIQGSRLSAEEGRERLLQAAGAHRPEEIVVRTAAGCPQCGGKGYKGRFGIYEILESNPTLRTLIQERARPSAIFDAAIAAGMHSLRHDALEKYVQGRIDLKQARAAYL